jgi:hypothetical protein
MKILDKREATELRTCVSSLKRGRVFLGEWLSYRAFRAGSERWFKANCLMRLDSK